MALFKFFFFFGKEGKNGGKKWQKKKKKMHEFCVRSGAGLEFQVGFPPFPPTSFTPSNPRFFHLIDKDDLLGVDYSKSGRLVFLLYFMLFFLYFLTFFYI